MNLKQIIRISNILKIFYKNDKEMINNHKELSENQIHNLLKNLKRML